MLLVIVVWFGVPALLARWSSHFFRLRARPTISSSSSSILFYSTERSFVVCLRGVCIGPRWSSGCRRVFFSPTLALAKPTHWRRPNFSAKKCAKCTALSIASNPNVERKFFAYSLNMNIEVHMQWQPVIKSLDISSWLNAVLKCAHNIRNLMQR